MSFTALAEQLLEEAKKLDSHVAAGRDVSNLATTAGAPDHKNFVVQFKESRERAINTANEFLRQAYGPRDYVREKLSSVSVHLPEDTTVGRKGNVNSEGRAGVLQMIPEAALLQAQLSKYLGGKALECTPDTGMST